MSDRDSALSALVERPRPTILAAAAVSLLAIAGLWIVSLLISRMPLSDQTAREFLFGAMYYLPFVALPIALYALRRPGLSASMRLNPLPPLATLAVILAAMLSVYLASVLDGAFERRRPARARGVGGDRLLPGAHAGHTPLGGHPRRV